MPDSSVLPTDFVSIENAFVRSHPSWAPPQRPALQPAAEQDPSLPTQRLRFKTSVLRDVLSGPHRPGVFTAHSALGAISLPEETRAFEDPESGDVVQPVDTERAGRRDFVVRPITYVGLTLSALGIDAKQTVEIRAPRQTPEAS